MSVGISLDELIVYSDHERRKWREWFAADPRRLDLSFQPGARFPTVGALLDHIFLVERRHLSRLEGGTPPDSTGLASSDVNGLFDYGDLVRGDLRRYVGELTEAQAVETLSFTIQTGPVTMTRRKLAVHILLHEVRHLAQIAFAARAAGHESPGTHDLFYCPDLA